jgi:hypothetical protein
MLKSIGVDSIKELRHRNPAHLKQMIEERHGPVVACPNMKLHLPITSGPSETIQEPRKGPNLM